MGCLDNKSLEALKDAGDALNKLMEDGKDALAALEDKLNEMQSAIDSFKPEGIEKLPNLQEELAKLGTAIGATDFAKAVAEIYDKFGDAVDDLQTYIDKLGFNKFPPSLDDLNSLCDNIKEIPNIEVKKVEVVDAQGATVVKSVAVVQPKEPIVPQTQPAAPVAKQPTSSEAISVSLMTLDNAMAKTSEFVNKFYTDKQRRVLFYYWHEYVAKVNGISIQEYFTKTKIAPPAGQELINQVLEDDKNDTTTSFDQYTFIDYCSNQYLNNDVTKITFTEAIKNRFVRTLQRVNNS